jgi:hypothetical protein
MPSGFTRLNNRVLTVILLVALPVLIIGAAIVISIGQSRLRQAEISRLAQIAEYTASAVDAYVFRRILDAALLGRVPDIRRVAAAGNGQPPDSKRVAEIDGQWQKDAAAAEARLGILKGPASAYLADIVKNDSIYREIMVTDLQGRLVAASNLTSDYAQADEGWWMKAFDGGRGRVYVSDVHRDESANVYAFEIAVPVPSPDGESLAGIMKIVADSREMLAGVAGLELGTTSDSMLVRPDGSLVFSRRPYQEGDQFFAADLLRQRIDERVSRKETLGRMTFDARAEDGSQRIVAVAPSQLARSYPELSWMAALSVDVGEVNAPFRSLLWYLLIVVALTALFVLSIALWLSLRLATPTIDPDYDLHLVEHARMTPTDAPGG